MSRKAKRPESKPSKAYLVSFGDTMTALLAFFIVLNSLAKDQTGAKMYAGTGSFVNAIKSLGIPGEFAGDRSRNVVTKTAPSPVYAVRTPEQQSIKKNGKGPDETSDSGRVIDRQAEDFQRFLNEMERQFVINEQPATRNEVVLDIWEKLGSEQDALLGNNAIQVASEAIAQLSNSNVELELVIWADMPSPSALQKAIRRARAAESQIEKLFSIDSTQRSRIRFSAKPWLFVDVKRPVASFIISRN